jgi:hypothetical protein
MSSEEEFLDIIYLGMFVILSPSFDRRFYSRPPPTLVDEVAYAIRQFQSLMHLFSSRFIVVLGGTPVAACYVLDRMLAEFAAAAVVFGKAVEGPFGEGNERGAVKITFARFLANITGILEDWSPALVPFFVGRVEAQHNNFLWTGPKIQILPRTNDLTSIIQLTGKGELLDLPELSIYIEDVDDESSAAPPSGLKRGRPEDMGDGCDGQPKKRQH